MCMRKWRTWVTGVSFLLTALLLGGTGCRQTCNHCGGSCDAGGSSTVPAPAMTSGYAGQRTCPVTGADLAGVAKPVAVTVRGETIYVCCQGCAQKVQQNPEPYLARVRAERAGSTTSLPAASVPATSALPLGGQKSCPVTGEPLDPSAAVAVTVRGQTIYVCCQSCAAKVKRDPEPYLAQVAAERAGQVGARP